MYIRPIIHLLLLSVSVKTECTHHFVPEITTVEGILRRVITGLSQDQNRRRQCYPESAGKIDEFIKRVERLINLQEKFTLVIHFLVLFFISSN